VSLANARVILPAFLQSGQTNGMEGLHITSRRWFRFSLRKLLIFVTLLCLYLGWAADWKRQRRVFLNAPNVTFAYSENGDAHVRLSLRLMGEQGINWIKCPDSEREKASSLFPEWGTNFSFNISLMR